MSAPRAGRCRSAFTLFEVLIVIGLLTLLSGSMFGLLWNLGATRDRLIEMGESEQAAGVILERIESDLICAVASAGDAAGVEGSATRVRILTRAAWLPRESGQGRGSAALADLQGTEVSFESGRLTASRWLGSAPAGEAEPVSGRITGCRFRYFDGREWAGSFDSMRAGALPVAIEASLWLVDAPAGRAPDRRRLMVIPDGPAAAWKERP